MGSTPKDIKEAFYKGLTGGSAIEVLSLVQCMPLLLACGAHLNRFLKSNKHGRTVLARCGPVSYFHKMCINSFDVTYQLTFWQYIAVKHSYAPDVVATRYLMPAVVEYMVLIMSTIALYTQVVTAQQMLLLGTLGLISTHYLQASATRKNSIVQDGDEYRKGQQQPSIEGTHAPGEDKHWRTGHVQDSLSPFPKFVSCFRGSLMLGTCCCILAVDFRAFPRRFAKTEEWGYSLMDMGVGGIVLASSCTSATATLARSNASKGSQHRRANLWDRLIASARSSAPCLVLWLVRLVSVKAIDYQEHVGEYGVHWNFFATLYFLSLLKAVVPVPTTVTGSGIMTAAVAIFHQVLLSAGGLGPWIRSESRDANSLLSLNKEGFGSLLGYWALALAGAWMATIFHHASKSAVSTTNMHSSTHVNNGPSKTVHEYNTEHNTSFQTADVQGSTTHVTSGTTAYSLLRTALPRLITVWCVLGSAWYISDQYLETASRRAANLTYILFVVFSSCTVLLTLFAAHCVLQCGLQSVLSCAASKHMLPVFLIANLLTGLVNISTDTLAITDWTARVVVAVYMAVVCGVAVAMDYCGLRLKL